MIGEIMCKECKKPLCPECIKAVKIRNKAYHDKPLCRKCHVEIIEHNRYLDMVAYTTAS